MSSNKKLSRVEQLVKDSETVKNEALKGALEKHALKEKEKEESKLLEVFNMGSRAINSLVKELKLARAREKHIKGCLKTMDNAFEKFKEDGNIEEFRKVTNSMFLGRTII